MSYFHDPLQFVRRSTVHGGELVTYDTGFRVWVGRVNGMVGFHPKGTGVRGQERRPRGT